MRTVGNTHWYCKCCGFDVDAPDIAENMCPARDGDLCMPVRRALQAQAHRRRIARQYPVTKDKNARNGGRASASVNARCAQCGHRGVDHPRDDDLKRPRKCCTGGCDCKRYTSRKVKAVVEIVRGNLTGLLAVYVNSFRVAGEKPWGGGHTVVCWRLYDQDVRDLRAALKSIGGLNAGLVSSSNK